MLPRTARPQTLEAPVPLPTLVRLPEHREVRAVDAQLADVWPLTTPAQDADRVLDDLLRQAALLRTVAAVVLLVVLVVVVVLP